MGAGERNVHTPAGCQVIGEQRAGAVGDRNLVELEPLRLVYDHEATAWRRTNRRAGLRLGMKQSTGVIRRTRTQPRKQIDLIAAQHLPAGDPVFAVEHPA